MNRLNLDCLLRLSVYTMPSAYLVLLFDVASVVAGSVNDASSTLLVFGVP